jgi:hypothetical protein
VPIQEFLRPAAKVEAVQWTGHNLDEVADLAADAAIGSTGGLLSIEVSDGPAVMKVNWWLVRDNGRLYVCSDTVKRIEGWEPLTHAV